MSKILAVGSPKGGVGKTTTAVTLAAIAAQVLSLRVLLIDADANESALSWARRADDDAMPFDIAPGAARPDELHKLRLDRRHDLTIVDLPGAREGGFSAMLTGADGRPTADTMLVPVQPEVMDLEPVVRVLRHDVIPLELPYLVALTKVDTASLSRAQARQNELRADLGLQVAATVVRRYSAYNEARERFTTVIDLPGRRSHARTAEAEYRALAAEIFGLMQLDTTALRRKSRWLDG